MKKELIKYAEGVGCALDVQEWILTHVPESADQTETEHILDYLASEKRPKRLKKASYEAMKKNSEKWTKSLSKKGEKIKEKNEDVEVVLDFGDGFKFVRLISENSYKREGFLMRHCVASFFGRDVKIFSLRDAKNQPHCTIEWGNQVKGKGNGPISPKYIKYVVEFMESQGMGMRPSEMENLGYRDVSWLGSCVSDDVILFRKKFWYGEGIPALKKGKFITNLEECVGEGPWIYGGDLNLRGTAITSLPDRLHVGGILDLENAAITSLPEGLHVSGYLDLRGTAITSLPDRLYVSGDLYLRGTAITSLPKGLHVGRDLSLEGTVITSLLTSLPKGLHVGRDLNLEGTAITSLPNDLYVGRDLYLRGVAITSLPEGLHVGDEIIR